MVLACLLWALQAAAQKDAPRALGWEDFPVFVWRSQYAGKPLPEELASPFGGVILMRDEDSAWARERGLSYLVWNVAGREPLHLDADEAWKARVEKWIETHDERLLVRTPCLNDPQTIEQMHATLDATLAKHGEHPGLGFVLGDEVSLTPNGDPFDLCRCGLCEEKWRAYAKERGLPERAPLTDEVRLGLLDDDFSLVGAWLARRRFDAELVRERLLDLFYRGSGEPRTAAEERGFDREHHRRPLFGLLGVAGTTAFGGIPGRMDSLDFWESYPVVDARERLLGAGCFTLHASTGTPPDPGRPQLLTTLFIDKETPDGLAWQVWDHWLRGGSGLVLWNDAALEAVPAHRQRLADAVATIRSLEMQGVKPRAEHSGVAILEDEDSVAAAFLREAMLDGPTWPRRTAGYQFEHGARERKIQSWLRLLEDCGELPSALPLGELTGDCASQYRLLVLADMLVLGRKDVSRLEAYLEQGGALVVDGTLGWIDREGKRWTTSVLDRLLLKGGERVRVAPASLSSYLDARLDPERVEASRAFLRGIPNTPALTPLRLGAEAGRLPWLVNRHLDYRRFLYGGEAIAILPNLVTSQERRRLHDVDIELSTGGGVQWLHPSDGHLRAGDAAVFVLQAAAPKR